MTASFGASIRVAAVTIILASVAGVVHWAGICYLHDYTCALRSTVAPSVVIASDLEAFATHRLGARRAT